MQHRSLLPCTKLFLLVLPLKLLLVLSCVEQMMGRAGRPQYDSKGVAVIMVHEPKKAFYKRFLYEPFPVESSLADQVLHGSSVS